MADTGSGDWTHEETIPSDTAIGSRMVTDLIAAMEQRGWGAHDIFHVQLAYEEAIVNAIRHGNQFDEEKRVEVRMCCSDQEVCIQITDMGAGFDPASLPDPRADDRLEMPGGRGVMLIRELMSEVVYNARGNRVTMKKQRNDNPPRYYD